MRSRGGELCVCVTQLSAPRLDATLTELQDLAYRQQQQIDAQQQLLVSKVRIQTDAVLPTHFSCLPEYFKPNAAAAASAKVCFLPAEPLLIHCVSVQEEQLRHLKLQDQRLQHQEVSEQERLQQLRENARNQEAKLRRVRALRGQVEQKRLSNSKLGQQVEG